MPEVRSVVSPHDQSATFVELFFDLVFVFCITQVVALLAHDLDAVGLGESLLVFWLVWWAWTQFTWALNAADTTHPWIEFWTLVATAVAFFMAVSIPGAFHGTALAFGITYVLVRVIGLAIYAWVASDESQRSAVTLFGGASLLGLAAVAAGAALGGRAQFWFWGAAILLDMVAAGIGARHGGWKLHAEHFAERHGLILIIALGESLIVAGAAVSGGEWTQALLSAAVLSVALTCALWWSYFPTAKPVLEEALTACEGRERSEMARDAFSLLHFPLICGVIGVAVALEEALAHPTEPLEPAVRVALAAGIALFLASTGGALWRVGGRLPLVRSGAAVAAAGIVLLPPLTPVATLSVALVPVLVVAVVRGRG